MWSFLFIVATLALSVSAQNSIREYFKSFLKLIFNFDLNFFENKNNSVNIVIFFMWILFLILTLYIRCAKI